MNKIVVVEEQIEHLVFNEYVLLCTSKLLR